MKRTTVFVLFSVYFQGTFSRIHGPSLVELTGDANSASFAVTVQMRMFPKDNVSFTHTVLFMLLFRTFSVLVANPKKTA